MAEARSIIHVENDQVRVTEWIFAPGDATGWHRHGYAYVITPVTGGPVEIVGPGGQTTQFLMQPGVSYYREAGVEHDVVWKGEGELRFVEVELKSRPG